MALIIDSKAYKIKDRCKFISTQFVKKDTYILATNNIACGYSLLSSSSKNDKKITNKYQIHIEFLHTFKLESLQHYKKNIKKDTNNLYFHSILALIMCLRYVDLCFPTRDFKDVVLPTKILIYATTCSVTSSTTLKKIRRSAWKIQDVCPCLIHILNELITAACSSWHYNQLHHPIMRGCMSIFKNNNNSITTQTIYEEEKNIHYEYSNSSKHKSIIPQQHLRISSTLTEILFNMPYHCTASVAECVQMSLTTSTILLDAAAVAGGSGDGDHDFITIMIFLRNVIMYKIT